MIGNQKVVQAFGRGADVTERFDEINERLRDASLRATFFSSITNPSTRFVNSLVYTGVGIAGAFAVVGGSLSVGQLSSFLSYANQYTKPFNEISGVVTEFQNAVACARRIFDLIAEDPQIPEPENAVDMKDIKGNVKAKDVSFSYTPEQKLIEHFNLSVRPGTANRHRRAYRMRKDDIDQSSHEVLRCRQRRHPCGRRGHKRDDQEKPQGRIRYGASGYLA